MKKQEIIDNILKIWLENEIYDLAWKNGFKTTLPATEQRRIALNQVIEAVGEYKNKFQLSDVLFWLTENGYSWVENLRTDMTYERLLYDNESNLVCDEKTFINHIDDLLNLKEINQLPILLSNFSSEKSESCLGDA